MASRDMQKMKMLGKVGSLQQWLYMDSDNAVTIISDYGTPRTISMRDDCKIQYAIPGMPDLNAQIWAPAPSLRDWLNWVQQLDAAEPLSDESEESSRMLEIMDEVCNALKAAFGA